MPKVKFFTSLSVLIFKFTKGVPMKAEDKGCVTQEPRKEVLLRSSVIFLQQPMAFRRMLASIGIVNLWL